MSSGSQAATEERQNGLQREGSCSLKRQGTESRPGRVDVAGYRQVVSRCAVADYTACCNTLPGQLQFMKSAWIHDGQGACIQLGELAASDVCRRHVMVAAAVQSDARSDLLNMERMNGTAAHEHIGAAAHGAQVHALVCAVEVFAQKP